MTDWLTYITEPYIRYERVILDLSIEKTWSQITTDNINRDPIKLCPLYMEQLESIKVY